MKFSDLVKIHLVEERAKFGFKANAKSIDLPKKCKSCGAKIKEGKYCPTCEKKNRKPFVKWMK